VRRVEGKENGTDRCSLPQGGRLLPENVWQEKNYKSTGPFEGRAEGKECVENLNPYVRLGANKTASVTKKIKCENLKGESHGGGKKTRAKF